MKGIDFTGIAYLVAFGIAAYIAYQVWQKGPAAITDAAKSVVDAINPASNTNLVNKAANVVVETLTGRSDETTGGWFYDLLNPNPMNVMSQMTEHDIAVKNIASSADIITGGIPALTGSGAQPDYITKLMTQMP